MSPHTPLKEKKEQYTPPKYIYTPTEYIYTSTEYIVLHTNPVGVSMHARTHTRDAPAEKGEQPGIVCVEGDLGETSVVAAGSVVEGGKKRGRGLKKEGKSCKGESGEGAISERTRGTRIPDDFVIDLGFAHSKGLSEADALRESEYFRDYWRAVPGPKGLKLDWQATWRNWVRRYLDRLSQGGYYGKKYGRGSMVGWGDEVAECMLNIKDFRDISNLLWDGRADVPAQVEKGHATK